MSKIDDRLIDRNIVISSSPNVVILMFRGGKKACIFLLILVALSKEKKLSEIISVCVSVLFTHFQHILTPPR